MPHAAEPQYPYPAGFFALTDAETEGPALFHIGDLSYVAFGVDGGEPSTVWIHHHREGACDETIVLEEIKQVLEQLAEASQELRSFEEGS